MGSPPPPALLLLLLVGPDVGGCPVLANAAADATEPGTEEVTADPPLIHALLGCSAIETWLAGAAFTQHATVQTTPGHKRQHALWSHALQQHSTAVAFPHHLSKPLSPGSSSTNNKTN